MPHLYLNHLCVIRSAIQPCVCHVQGRASQTWAGHLSIWPATLDTKMWWKNCWRCVQYIKIKPTVELFGVTVDVAYLVASGCHGLCFCSVGCVGRGRSKSAQQCWRHPSPQSCLYWEEGSMASPCLFALPFKSSSCGWQASFTEGCLFGFTGSGDVVAEVPRLCHHHQWDCSDSQRCHPEWGD